MQPTLYIATRAQGGAWVDLHDDPVPFTAAQDIATSAMLRDGCMTRLRLARPRRKLPPGQEAHAVELALFRMVLEDARREARHGA